MLHRFVWGSILAHSRLFPFQAVQFEINKIYIYIYITGYITKKTYKRNLSKGACQTKQLDGKILHKTNQRKHIKGQPTKETYQSKNIKGNISKESYQRKHIR